MTELPQPLQRLHAATTAAAFTSVSPVCCVGAGDTAPLRNTLHRVVRGILLRYKALLPAAAWLRVCCALARVLLKLQPHTCCTATCSIGAPLDALPELHGRAGGRAGEACVLCSTVLCIAEAAVSVHSTPSLPVRLLPLRADSIRLTAQRLGRFVPVSREQGD